MSKKQKEYTCTIEFTEGAEQRITDAFVDLYYGILSGVYSGPLLTDKDKKDETV